MDLHRREWGAGHPVLAMAPLGLESSAFAGLGRTLARFGWRTIGIDLPGFGQTPASHARLTPAALAEPVIALARSLERPPVVLGVSLGGRVALEAATTAPEAFRSVIAIAPYLPWRRFRALADAAAIIDPAIADWIPLERAWPVLRWLARLLETTPYVREDELAQAGARLVYFLSCPATRRSMFSAGRELALDPGHGPTSLWTRLPSLTLPAAFVWAERDQMISLRFSGVVARHCPQARQLLLPCLGHWLNGVHHRCLAEAVGRLLAEMEGHAPNDCTAGVRTLGPATLELRGCVVGAQRGDQWIPEATGFEGGRHVG
jgi:pimeloyl-ACP methyl ester carboxylesterase